MPNNDYRSAVHSMLSSAYEGEFKLSEADFRNKLDSNPEYAKTVYSLMSSAFPLEFKLKENEFTSKMYSDPKATSTPTADPQQAAAPQEQAPTYVGPGLKYKPYFKHMLPSLRESQTFQLLLIISTFVVILFSELLKLFDIAVVVRNCFYYRPVVRFIILYLI